MHSSSTGVGDPASRSHRGGGGRWRGWNSVACLSNVVAFWRGQAPVMVPDPAEGGISEYDPCARWLAVVKELDESAYRQILEDWAVRHARRRNLWRDLAARGITRWHESWPRPRSDTGPPAASSRSLKAAA